MRHSLSDRHIDPPGFKTAIIQQKASPCSYYLTASTEFFIVEKSNFFAHDLKQGFLISTKRSSCDKPPWHAANGVNVRIRH